MTNTNKEKYLVVKYFDYYAEKEYYFDTEEEARDFEKQENDKIRHYPNTEFICKVTLKIGKVLLKWK